MMFNPIFKIILLFVFLVFALSCGGTQKKETNEVITDNEPGKLTTILNENDTSNQMNADSLLDVKKFQGISSIRLNEIEQNLNRINSEFNAEKRNLTIATGGEVFRLNKKHLELKVKVRKSMNFTGSSWAEFETSLITELDMLDTAISNFDKRREQN